MKLHAAISLLLGIGILAAQLPSATAQDNATRMFVRTAAAVAASYQTITPGILQKILRTIGLTLSAITLDDGQQLTTFSIKLGAQSAH